MPIVTEKALIKYIWVTFQKEGIHKYPAALTDPALSEVSFLGYPHRHMFFHKVWLEVFHDDRDVEFILFKRWLESLYDDQVLSLDYKSCEMMAEVLYEKISDKYPNRSIIIEISEDNENGCRHEYSTIVPIVS